MISYQSSVKIQTRKCYTQRCCEINILHGKELKSGESTLKPSVHKGATYGKFEELMDD